MIHRKNKGISRREFLKVAAVGAGAVFVNLDRIAAAGGLLVGTQKNIPIGVQLYSVRGAAQ